MEPMMIGILGILALFVFLVLGVHIGVALGLVGLVGTIMLVGFGSASMYVANSFYHRISYFALLTVPLFIMMGYLAAGGGVNVKLYDMLCQWVGWLKGGLGIATVLSCAGFGTVTGSSLVATTVFAKLASPEMRRYGYHKGIAYAIPASAGCIGMLIPPSILMVVYGEMSGESIGKLLIAGIVPGILLSICLSVVIMIIAWRRPDLIPPLKARGVTWRKRFSSALGIWPVFIAAAIIIGGIFGGVFSPTEAGAVANFALLALVLAIRRGDAFGKVIWPAMKDAVSTTAMIFLLFAGANVFGHFLVLVGINRILFDFIVGLHLSPIAFMVVMVLVYLALGCFLDCTSMVCITVPLFNPVATALGINPMWYAMVVILAMHAGEITPPLGINLYGAKAVAESDVPVEEIFKSAVPFLIGTIVATGIMLAFPWLSITLPNLMVGG